MNRKTFQTVIVTLIILLQSLFLAAIMLENYQKGNQWNLVFIIFLSLLLLIAYIKIPSLHQKMDYEHLKVIVWVPVGAVITYLLAVDMGLGSVVSAALVGTIFSIIPNVSKSIHAKKVPVAVYCGAFVGMSSVEVAQSLAFVLISGIVAGFFLMLSKNLFMGLGGKLGMLAFASVVITYLIFYLI